MSSLHKSDVNDDIESLIKELELEQDINISRPPKIYKKKSVNVNQDISIPNNNSNNNNNNNNISNNKPLETKKTNNNTTNTINDELNDILQELSEIDSPQISNRKSSRPSNIYTEEEKSSLINEKKIVNSNISNTTLLDDKSTLNKQTTSHEVPSSIRKAKCTTLCIGGQEGITIGNNQKSCSKLRCTSCDFNCMYFKDYKWSNKVDYLFFRNYVPNVEKLSEELIPKKGHTSICCQCTWLTVDKTTPISSIKDKKIKWSYPYQL
ncbi:hypothetical protein LY90DRAFT_667669 [Neocallimastix californiae]|uniref:Cilia- and flagella-associated protein 418 n=1 Tax=Neocallimastix californiae TaxID=1754190 RepID=A0A1Y2E8W6_9FUNG|nr:hypothetical protein LY90DRAFT_667669 [Neocallimastix californiae]|eukprot:ORY68013.1 hypothetical protein LY90DRAFT_667669 [Neocallimastix californiae]